MTDRSSLGPADVTDEELAGMVAELLGHDAVEVLDLDVRPVDYDVPSITTIGRWWVAGTASTPAGVEQFRLFVKLVQAWHHSEWFRFVPEEARTFAAASYPWRIEAAVYESDLADRLPAGLSMPRAVGVHDREPDQVAVWTEVVDHPDQPWDLARHERAAYLLGRLSASPAVEALGNVGDFDWTVMSYVVGRVGPDVVPAVLSDEPWRRPVVERCFGDLEDRFRAECDRIEERGGELMSMPHLRAHGDASPGNLLAGARPDEIVLIDFGFFHANPVGFDLTQLVTGEAQLGRLPDVSLAELDETCLAAYVRGLRDESCDLPLDVVRRSHALHLWLFNGISSLPEAGMTDEHAAARAQVARLALDLLDTTD